MRQSVLVSELLSLLAAAALALARATFAAEPPPDEASQHQQSERRAGHRLQQALDCLSDADCDDGDVCNGLERCGDGQCSAGTPVTCCDHDPPELCNQQFAICMYGTNAGAPCGHEADCPGGSCEFCRPDCRVRLCSSSSVNRGAPCTADEHCPLGVCLLPDEQCDDGLSSTGCESCNLNTGLCERDASLLPRRPEVGGGMRRLPVDVATPMATPSDRAFACGAYCQAWDESHELSFSDLAYLSGILVADDFVFNGSGTQLSELCVWGSYTDDDLIIPESSCAYAAVDRFRVRVLADTGYGLPDTTNVIGVSQASSTRTFFGTSWPDETWLHELSLLEPIAGLVAGDRYWLEVANDIESPPNCIWNWNTVGWGGPDGNRYSARGSETNGYPLGSEWVWDYAFCLAEPFDPPPTPQRRCYGCEGECNETELATCAGAFHLAGVDDTAEPLTCADPPMCPVDAANDECWQAPRVGMGTHVFDLTCATTDGWNPVPTDDGYPANIVNDVWFEFVAPQDGTATFDTCVGGYLSDMVLAVYSDGSGSCVCPTHEAVATANLVAAADESCTSAAICCGPARLSVEATLGQCFTVRIGLYQSVLFHGTGRAWLDISMVPACGDSVVQPGEQCDGVDDGNCPGACFPPGHVQQCLCEVSYCGDEVRQWSEECDGADDPACPGACNPPGHPQECHCGNPVCGNGVLDGLEECDPGPPLHDNNCPGQCQSDCTCNDVCGNGNREFPEECDGPDDTSCAGVPDRCLPDCTCPPAECGNGVRDRDEECDPGAPPDFVADDAACMGGQCRLPGDPAGGCTCACGVCPPIPAPPSGLQYEDPLQPIWRNRFLGFVLPDIAYPLAVRARLVTLNHPRFCCTDASGASCGTTACDTNAHCTSAPNVTCAHQAVPGVPDFSAFEGEYRYLNTYRNEVNEPALECADVPIPSSYPCARLGCLPEYRIWPAGAIYVTGDSVLPSSMYELDIVLQGGGTLYPPSRCESTSLIVHTARWGDISSAGFGLPDGVANVLDMPAVTNKLREVAPMLGEPRVLLHPAEPNPHGENANVIDLSYVVDALTGRDYPWPGLQACK